MPKSPFPGMDPYLEQAYQEGHHDMLDYSRPLDPPLPAAEAEFAERVLKQAGKK
jgi:hypothetical protein